MNARAAIFDGPGRPFRLRDLHVPDRLSEGEALVEITLATICGSDLHTVAGRRREYVPCILGHEAVGRVVAAGAERECWLGKRVTWTLADSCGTCAPCAEWDLPQKCARLFKYGHALLSDGAGLNGAYASHILLRSGTHVVEVPEEIDDAVAATANCSLATMVAVTERLPEPCQVAVVQGAGLLGLHACALLRAAGVSRVWVTDPDAGRRQRAAEYGAAPTASAEIAAGSVDLVIEAAGTAKVVPEALRILRPGGHYYLAGMVHPDSALDLSGEAIIRACLIIRGFHNYAPRHLDKAVAFLRDSRHQPWAGLTSPPLPLAELDKAFVLAAERQWARVAVRNAA